MTFVVTAFEKQTEFCVRLTLPINKIWSYTKSKVFGDDKLNGHQMIRLSWKGLKYILGKSLLFLVVSNAFFLWVGKI